jgi:hypothetical protein
MAGNGTLNGNHGGRPLGSGADDRIMAALLSGDTPEQAARKASCSPRTVWRRLADPGFKARLGAYREQLFRSLIDLLVVDAHAAGRRLAQHVADADAEVSLKACGIVLQSTLKARDRGEISAQMAELIERAKDFAERFPAPFTPGGR